MSWSFGVPESTIEEFEANARKVWAENGIHYNDVGEHVQEAVELAIQKATSIVRSGVVGTDKVVASLSGHANADHKPQSGWSNDTVTISVTSTEKPTPEA